MLTAASWGLADLVDDGTVGKEQATEMFAHLVEQVMTRGPAPRRRSKAAASPRPGKRKNVSRGDPHG
jgi:hypothetical protein